jgi:hypothetical protein
MSVRKMLYAAAVLVAGWAGFASAATAVGPVCYPDAKVTAASCTYDHYALDFSAPGCGEWNHRAMLLGNYYYRYSGGCTSACSDSSCNGGAGNHYVVVGSNGWDFRQLYVTSNASTGSKTCDRCALGLTALGHGTGILIHADNRQYGVRKSAWYTSAGITCGSSAYCGNVVGYPTL